MHHAAVPWCRHRAAVHSWHRFAPFFCNSWVNVDENEAHAIKYVLRPPFVLGSGLRRGHFDRRLLLQQDADPVRWVCHWQPSVFLSRDGPQRRSQGGESARWFHAVNVGS